MRVDIILWRKLRRRYEKSDEIINSLSYGWNNVSEKAADFGAEGVLLRAFDLDSEVNQVKIKLAFSSNDLHQRTSALLLVQSENK